MRHPCRKAGGKRPVSRPAEESGLKPSLATTTAKASERMIADPLGWAPSTSFSVPSSPFSVPSQGRSVTRARRLYVSRLANFRVSDPRHGAAHRDVRCRHCAMDGAFGGHHVPPLGAYMVSLLCVV